jgi:hypothetical protein
MSVAALFVATLLISGQDPRPRADCQEWRECRQLAMDAAQREDYETFHDLAWRAVQTGPKNDLSLMYLLARAQSLSGRPADALVMLVRLADAGFVMDAAGSDDFQRVRALPGWSAIREKIEAVAAGPNTGTPSTAGPTETVAPPKRSAIDATRSGPTPATVAPNPILAAPKATGIEKGSPAGTAGLKRSERASAAADDAVRFATPGAAPVGIAYDAVSRRFVVADRATRKLAVVDEFSRHVATLAGAQAAFADIGALEIDPRAGNLWVVSSEPGGAPPVTTLHKLQLVSGRVLSAFVLPPALAPGHFVDVAIGSEGSVLALDDEKGRVFRFKGGPQVFEVAATLDVGKSASVAPAENAVAYVAHETGLVRVDLRSGASVAVKSANQINVTGLSRIRWYRGSLVGIQKDGSTYRVVRLALDRSGRTVRAADLLDPSMTAADATAATIAGDVLYYLAESAAGEATVRKVKLK